MGPSSLVEDTTGCEMLVSVNCFLPYIMGPSSLVGDNTGCEMLVSVNCYFM